MAEKAEKWPREAAEHAGAPERGRIPVHQEEAGCGCWGRPSEAAAGEADEVAAEKEVREVTIEGREPSATTGERQQTERRAAEEEERKEEVKKTRKVMRRKARRRSRARERGARRRRAATWRHDAKDGHVKKAGGEQRALRRGGELSLQAWEDRACGSA